MTMTMGVGYRHVAKIKFLQNSAVFQEISGVAHRAKILELFRSLIGFLVSV